MKSVVLSSTEAEYTEVSEVVQDMQFLLQVLQTMEIQVQLSIKGIMLAIDGWQATIHLVRGPGT